MLTKLFLVFAALSRVDAFLTSPSEDELFGRAIQRKGGGIATTSEDIAGITGRIDQTTVLDQVRTRLNNRVAQLAEFMCVSTGNVEMCNSVEKYKKENRRQLTTPFCTSVASGEYEENLVEEFGWGEAWCYRAENCADAFTYTNRLIDIPGTGMKKTNVFRKCTIDRSGTCRVENMGAQNEDYSHKFVAHLCNMACVNDPDSVKCVDEIPICCDDFENCETCQDFLEEQMMRSR